MSGTISSGDIRCDWCGTVIGMGTSYRHVDGQDFHPHCWNVGTFTGETAEEMMSAEMQLDDAAQVFGIIDPDYARVFTQARILAWSYGYACLAHGSFTRDLDLLLVPWQERATREIEPLVRRLANVTGLKLNGPPSDKSHGRQAWTLLFPGINDVRWVDVSAFVPPACDSTCHIAPTSRVQSSAPQRIWLMTGDLSDCDDDVEFDDVSDEVLPWVSEPDGPDDVPYIRADLAHTAPPAVESEALAWLVLDADGNLMHASQWKSAAHEHINDAINNHGLTEAATWKVRPVYAYPSSNL